MRKGALPSSHYLGETAIQIDYIQLGIYFSHKLRHTYAKVSLGYLWYNLGAIHGGTRAAHSGTNQLPGRSGPACPWTHI
jgi:hypothetical protein